MTEHMVIAVGMALVVEAAHWLRLRWHFDDTAYIRAWQLTQISAACLAVYVWLEGDRLSALQRLMSWLPALFLPVQLAQIYGLKDSMPLSTFSFFARQRQLRNERLGLRDTSTRLNFGNVFFVSCLVAATLGPLAESVWFLNGLLFLIGWAVLAALRTRLAPLLLALAFAGGFAVTGQASLKIANEKLLRYYRGGHDGPRNPNVTDTAIGSLGEIKQSKDIQWRLRVNGNGMPPTHLKTIVFNKYRNAEWINQRAEGRDKDFDWLAIDEITEGSNQFVISPSETDPPVEAKLPSFRLRGKVEEESQLPLPGSAAIIHGFKLETIDHNSMGTVRINPSNAIIDGTVFWKHRSTIEVPPERQDYLLPKLEESTILRIAAEIGLHGEPTLKGKLDLISGWFAREFKYTRYLTTPVPGEFALRRKGRENMSRGNAIAVFLTNHREGHCEYFATAASLLLRAAGTPSRYAVGFSVREMDGRRNEFLIRGTHAHAWCRVWDEEKEQWIDFDPTPGNWLAMEGIRPDWKQPFKDWLLRVREDFALWRTDTENRTGLAIGMMSFAVIALAFIGRRLWRSKHMVGPKASGRPVFDITRTPLHELEPMARKILGPRPPGLPFSRWLSGLRGMLGDAGQLDEAIQLHQRLRYDPEPPGSTPVERLKTLVDGIKDKLKAEG
ncbi:MAG: transglutaminase domain-containing protein [Akkermansiaceae bacterium]|nr:transglutaminase domain-containing protein [Akkermansiaceae bacterium]